MSSIRCTWCGDRDEAEFVWIAPTGRNEGRTDARDGERASQRWFHRLGCGRAIDVARPVDSNAGLHLSAPTVVVLPPVPVPAPASLDAPPAPSTVESAPVSVPGEPEPEPDLLVAAGASSFSFGVVSAPASAAPCDDAPRERWSAVARDDGRVINRRVASPVGVSGGKPQEVPIVSRRAVEPAARLTAARRGAFDNHPSAEPSGQSLFQRDPSVRADDGCVGIHLEDSEDV